MKKKTRTTRIKQIIMNLDDFENQHPIIYPGLICLIFLFTFLYASYLLGYPKVLSDTLRYPNLGWLQFWGTVFGGLLTFGGVYATIIYYRKRDIAANIPVLEVINIELAATTINFLENKIVALFTKENGVAKKDQTDYQNRKFFFLKINNYGGPSGICTISDICFTNSQTQLEERVISDYLHIDQSMNKMAADIFFHIMEEKTISIGISNDLYQENIDNHLLIRFIFADKFNNRYIQTHDFFISKEVGLTYFCTYPPISESNVEFASAINDLETISGKSTTSEQTSPPQEG